MQSAEDIDAAEAAYLAARVNALHVLPGNPYRAEFRSSGTLQGFLVQSTARPMMNQIRGHTHGAPDTFSTLVEWFAPHYSVPAVTLVVRTGKSAAKHLIGTHSRSRINGWTHL